VPPSGSHRHQCQQAGLLPQLLWGQTAGGCDFQKQLFQQQHWQVQHLLLLLLPVMAVGQQQHCHPAQLPPHLAGTPHLLLLLHLPLLLQVAEQPSLLQCQQR
jgi:hypothetical protein